LINPLTRCVLIGHLAPGGLWGLPKIPSNIGGAIYGLECSLKTLPNRPQAACSQIHSSPYQTVDGYICYDALDAGRVCAPARLHAGPSAGGVRTELGLCVRANCSPKVREGNTANVEPASRNSGATHKKERRGLFLFKALFALMLLLCGTSIAG